MFIACCYLLYFKQIKQSKFEIIKGILWVYTIVFRKEIWEQSLIFLISTNKNEKVTVI